MNNALANFIVKYATTKTKQMVDSIQQDIKTSANNKRKDNLNNLIDDVRTIEYYIDEIKKLASEELVVSKRSGASNFRILALQKIITDCNFIKLHVECSEHHCVVLSKDE